MRRTPPRLPLLAAVLGLAALAAAPAAQAQDAEPAPTEPPVVITAKEGGWGILELFENINKATGRSIIFDDTNQKVKTTKITFIGDHVVPADDLFDWLQAVLSVHGLVLVPAGPKGPPPENRQQWFVMEQANPALRSRPVYVAEDEIFRYEDRDGLYVVTSLTMKNISDVTRVRNALSQLTTQTAGLGRVVDVPGSRSLIVGDFAPVVAAMKRLMEYIDVVDTNVEPQLKVVPLDHAVASELAPLIEELIQSSDVAQVRAPRQPGQVDEEPEPKIIADDRLDALIIYATDKPMAKIEQLIEDLDIPTRARGRLHFRPLKHTDAGEMATLLENLISGVSEASSGTLGSSRTTRRTRTGAQPTGAVGAGPASPFGGGVAEGEPVIIPDPKSNSLIVHASPTQYDAIDDLIDKLDRSRPQVLIETVLVELALSDTLQLGAEVFNAQSGITVDTDGDGTPDTITNAAKYFGGSSFGLSETVTQEINGVTVPVNRSPLLGTGLTAGIFKNGELPILLTAFQTASRAKILTMPSLVTNDNVAATLTLERTTSFLENIRTDTGSERDTFEQVTATTELEISPHISSDNYLRLHITQTVSNFGARPSPNAPPDQTSRTVDTEVTLPDTYTVVVGGLIQEEQRSTVSKVPILGDIPILGFLFRQTEDASTPSHLFLFVTPRILRDTERFTDYHKLTWERKLLQDDLFGQEVELPTKNFHGPQPTLSPEERIRRLEESGTLDSARLKAPPSEDERRRQAEIIYRRRVEAERTGAPAEEGGER